MKINTRPGDTFGDVFNQARQLAIDKSTTVEFEFNEITCMVTPDMTEEMLWEDYRFAHLMDWKIVPVERTDEVNEEIQRRLIARGKKHNEEQAEYRRRAEAERAACETLTAGVTMEFSDEIIYNEYREKNKDPYGKCAVDYAESWAKLMQVEIAKGKTVAQCAEECSNKLGFYGITGFMYGCAVSMLVQCWKYGEELRRWHNKEYGHEGEGVVNPAILTLQTA